MDNLIDAHYFRLPTQGNIYSVVNLSLTNGTNKALIASLKRKIYSCEFYYTDEGTLIPTVKEVPFTYIPNGAEIISIDAFNRADMFDDFFIGITIIKVNGGQNIETYLNIYTEQEIDENIELNLDSIAQNCLMLELSFIPYQLYHTHLLTANGKKEIVWLLSGSDCKVHMFREDPQNHAYSETDTEELFPEFNALPGIVISFDIKHIENNKRRLSAIGTECGLAKFCVIDAETSTLLIALSEQFDGPLSCISIFNLFHLLDTPDNVVHVMKCHEERPHENHLSSCYNLVVVNSLQPSVVYMDILKEGLSDKHTLPDNDKYDATLTLCLADINMDGELEILLGTYSQVILVCKFKNSNWFLNDQRRFADPIHSINSMDLTGDGVCEFLILTLTGIHVLQHNPVSVLKLFKQRLNLLSLPSADKEDGTDLSEPRNNSE